MHGVDPNRRARRPVITAPAMLPRTSAMPPEVAIWDHVRACLICCRASVTSASAPSASQPYRVIAMIVPAVLMRGPGTWPLSIARRRSKSTEFSSPTRRTVVVPASRDFLALAASRAPATRGSRWRAAAPRGQAASAPGARARSIRAPGNLPCMSTSFAPPGSSPTLPAPGCKPSATTTTGLRLRLAGVDVDDLHWSARTRCRSKPR